MLPKAVQGSDDEVPLGSVSGPFEYSRQRRRSTHPCEHDRRPQLADVTNTVEPANAGGRDQTFGWPIKDLQ